MPPTSPYEASHAEDRREILDEIARLRDALTRKIRSSVKGSTDGIIIARLCAGLTLDEWDEIIQDGHFMHWLALPASGDATPHLARLQRTLEELAHQTRHDPLTGLANRRAFEKVLKMELERSYRSGTSLSLAILDLDDFKAVNDTYGHLCGDRVLVGIAGTLLGHKRGYDLAARIGGEEFALILPGSGLMQAETTLMRLLDESRGRQVTCEGVADPVGVTCSAGLVCTKGKMHLTVERFIGMADKALYEAKAQGKNRIVKAPIPDLLETPQATLVHAQEKQFLFTGPDT
ncbi:GGDEF domain-containing protein [Fundidesulfovibrio terrae]|uniref:GGDEF domain-containing protein n=1 Tax=Fundidesulfovibrio terrae TaxID=2922866 RepID=UPI001FB04A2E|nr:GGDEF domain-containing protein [Fundidesulfovibrio terrae]